MKIKKKDLGETYREIELKCKYCESELKFPDFVTMAMHLQLSHPGERLKADWVGGFYGR
jgi:hypothetical protein